MFHMHLLHSLSGPCQKVAPTQNETVMMKAMLLTTKESVV